MNGFNWLFPPRCVLCGRLIEDPNDQGLCGQCRPEEYRYPEPLLPEGRCSFRYEDRMQAAIRRLKYEGKSRYGVYFARWMFEEGGDWAASQDFDRMTAVPLAARRLKSRGYNQAELIARELSRLCRVPYEDLLIRTKNTRPQSGLGADMRRRNLSGVFEAREARRPAHICLVDDIYTTGATAALCREALQKKWPEAKVTCWVLAGRNSSNFSRKA